MPQYIHVKRSHTHTCYFYYTIRKNIETDYSRYSAFMSSCTFEFFNREANIY